MNPNVCANCQENFNYLDRTGIPLSGCAHKICEVCLNGCEGDFVCPLDGLSSVVTKRKSPGGFRSDRSRKQLLTRNDETSIMNSSNKGDEADSPNLLEHQDSLRPSETLGPAGPARRLAADEQSRDALPKGPRDPEANRSFRLSEQGIRARPLERCELHSDHFLDIICKNPKCQKYVCLECVAFGNHAVR